VQTNKRDYLIQFILRVRRFTVKRIKSFFNYTINRPVGTIYMLHRVADIDKKKFPVNEELKVSPEYLEKFIISRKDLYDFISINDLINYKLNKIKFNKPFIIFTIDDGYKDNYTLAYPIFKKYNIPFIIYLATDLINNDKPFLWWYYLEEIIANHNVVELATGDVYNCSGYFDKLQLFNELRPKILDLAGTDFEALFMSLFNKYPEELSKNYSELILSWEDILEMSKDPLCTIGSHSKSHRRLSLLSQYELTSEISGSKEIIESNIPKKVVHFSYPYGSLSDINDDIYFKASESEFISGVISFGGNVRKYTKNLFALPRTMVKEDLN
jgi:peptidoglycan/xylan/chitin deacetylase (PgdA/CDA1 family)